MCKCVIRNKSQKSIFWNLRYLLTNVSILNSHICRKFEKCNIREFSHSKKSHYFCTGVYLHGTLHCYIIWIWCNMHMAVIFSSVYDSVWHSVAIASTWRRFLRNAAMRLLVGNSAIRSCAWVSGIPQSHVVSMTHWCVYILWYPDKISLWAIPSN